VAVAAEIGKSAGDCLARVLEALRGEKSFGRNGLKLAKVEAAGVLFAEARSLGQREWQKWTFGKSLAAGRRMRIDVNH
jgi:hypothetical protein